MTISYQSTLKGNASFEIKEDEEKHLLYLQDATDNEKMNWVKNLSDHYWGEVKTNLPLDILVTRDYTENNEIVETYEFKNNNDFEVFLNGTELGIFLTFPDYYGDAKYCMTHCCHTHVWCGDSVSYVMTLKMGGEGKNLGLFVTKGALKDYSIERNLNQASNDRGSFIMHPENFSLKPGESYTLSWKLFWHEGKEDFYNYLKQNQQILIHAPHYVLYQNEKIAFDISLPKDQKNIQIELDGEKVPHRLENGKVSVEYRPKEAKVYSFKIAGENFYTHCDFLVKPELDELVASRVKFITEKQQVTDKNSHLYGAYIIYDNEEKTTYYDFVNTDHNAARERLGMGALIASFLRKHKDDEVQKSIDLYEKFVYRELFDDQTGEVFNSIKRTNKVKRLYNYPFVALFILELYKLKKNDKYLIDLYHCLMNYYEKGGTKFYAFEIPMKETYQLLVAAHHDDLAKNILEEFEKHGKQVIENGLYYPKHEVNYEQSIVAPGAIIMIQLYEITKKKIYLDEAIEQVRVLDLFHGEQPDYHLYQTGIRHWDGYWFGKRAMYGDTYPHYWSALSALAFYPIKDIEELKQYSWKAEDVFRSVLPLFFNNGSASCAMVYPITVNGQRAHYYDEWANDQDFGLYFTYRNSLEKADFLK